MNMYRLTCILVLAILAMVPLAAQTGQNQPIYDPNDPIGRLLPPNLYFLIDTSGSMSCQPNGASGGQCSNYDWGGMRTDSKIYITKTAITDLMSRDNLRVRWSFWNYTGSGTDTASGNIDQDYTYFPTGLRWYENREWHDTNVWVGTNCNFGLDRLLVPIKHSGTTPPSNPLSPEWFASCVDTGFDNRADIRSWIDRDFTRTTGAITVPNMSNKFLKEIGARGSTPIADSLRSILRYVHGINLNGSAANCNYFNFTTGNNTNWTPTEKNYDPYTANNCRYSAVLLLTDGVANCPDSTSGPTNAAAAATVLHQNNIDTFVVGFGLQSTADKTRLNTLASNGGTGNAYFADNSNDLLAALEDVMGRLGSEVSGDTEPILGFIKPGTNVIPWPVTMPNDVQLQNVVIKASTTFSPVFKGHLRAFQALTTSSQDGKIDFLTDFTKNSPYLLWDAADYIDNLEPTTRNVYFFDGTTRRSFDLNNKNQIKQVSGLSLGNTEMDAFIDWVRGQQLGAITYSTPAFQGPPNPKMYSDPTYLAWADNLKDRTPIVLVGSNDGMLHCFNLKTGEEMWALIVPNAIEGTSTKPPTLYTQLYASGNTTSQGQPDVYGPRIYGRRPHYYYAACPPKTLDIRTSSGRWKTVCVFGVGAGGREYYCIDITDPADPQFMWRFAGVSGHPLGETWSVPALGRFAPGSSNYPFGIYGAVVGSGFNLNPTNPDPTTIGKSVYILNLDSSGTAQVLYQHHLTDTSQTGFGSLPTSLLTSVGNCFFAPPALYESSQDFDQLADKIYIGDYAGNLYRIMLDRTAIANSTFTKIFVTKNGTPIYSVPYVAELYMENAGRKTLVAFSEYGSPTDTTVGGTRLPGVAYLLVEENLTSTTTTASELVQTTGVSSSFDPSNSKGFYYELNASTGESIAFRPTLFWKGRNPLWMAFTSYAFFPGGTGCDQESHTVGSGRSSAYVLDLMTARYLNAAGPTELASGGTWYGRASAFHKGARGEGWIDVGTGDTWGWGYSQSTGKFEKFDASKGNITFEMNPVSGVEVHNNYWREFK